MEEEARRSEPRTGEYRELGSMTIAAGFVCSDGILLCADTRLSSEVTQHGQKIWVSQHSTTNWSLAVTGAGDHLHVRAVKDAILGTATPSSDIFSVVQAAVRGYFVAHVFPDPQYPRG